MTATPIEPNAADLQFTRCLQDALRRLVERESNAAQEYERLRQIGGLLLDGKDRHE